MGYWLGRIGFFSTGNSYPHTSIFAATDSGGSNGAALIFNTTTTANVSSPIERGRFRSDGTFEIKGAALVAVVLGLVSILQHQPIVLLLTPAAD
jgi:hypothetical protein